MFVEAVLWMAQTGAPWRDLPIEFGPWNTTFRRFSRWADKGVWQTIFARLSEDADFEEVFLDSTIVRAHEHAAGASKKGQQGIGCSRGGLSTKIHAAVDGLGNLGRFRLTGGERHDITEAANLLDGMENVGAVLADKAFDAASLLARIRELGAKAVIPPRANRKESRDYDIHHYRSRNLIERFFARIKQFRRIATRYDKLAVRFEAFISITAAFIWLA